MSLVRVRIALATLCITVLAASGASAQVFGTFSWQMQPYCNVVTMTITQFPVGYTLDGFDDQCGSTRRGGITGQVAINTDGTVGLNFTIVTAPGGADVHVSAIISPATGSGTWSDNVGNSGNLVLGASTGGSPRSTNIVQFRVAGLATAQAVTATAALTNWTTTPVYNVGGGTYTPAAGSYRVPVAGLYLIATTVRWTGFGGAVPSGSYKCTFIKVNGGGTLGADTCDLPTTASFQIQSLSTVTALSANDVITIAAFQSTAAGTVGSAVAADSSFTVTRLR